MHAVITRLNFSEQYVALNFLQNCAMEELHLAGHIFIVQSVNNAIVPGGTRITTQSKLQQH